MKRGAVFAIVIGVVVALSSAGAVGWSLLPRDKPEPVAVTFDTLDVAHGAVRIHGTAHYRGVVTQHVPAGLFTAEQKYWVYGLFPVYDTEGREIRVLVRSPFEPPRRVDYEYVELEGWIDRPRPHTIPMRTEELLARADYFFGADVVVIEPWSHRTVDPADLAGEPTADEEPAGDSDDTDD